MLRTHFHSHCEIQVSQTGQMGTLKEGYAQRLRCTQSQEGIGLCMHIHIRSKFTYSKWEPHDHEQHRMSTHIDTYTPRFPSQLYRMTERPGALQTALKDIHTAMTVSGWKKKNTEKYCLGEQNWRVNPSNVWN